MEHNISPGRSTFLSFVLATLGLLFFGLVLLLLTGGFFSCVLGTILAMILLGGFHWLLWGRAFSNQVAGEREEEKLRQRVLDNPPTDELITPSQRAGPETRIKSGPSQRFRRL